MKPEHSRVNPNVSDHTDLLCVLETSLLMREIHVGQMSKLAFWHPTNCGPRIASRRHIGA
jgi:hypothetical protein